MRRTALITLLAVATSFAFGVAPASAQKQTLRMAYWAGPAHQMVQTQQAWIKTIEAASGCNLTVEVDKAPLAKPEGQYDLIKNGIRDLVWAVPGYTPGRFDMLQVAELRPLEVVREVRLGRKGVPRHDAANHVHDRSFPGAHDQRGADAR